MKICSKCTQKYPLDIFIKNRQCKDGYGGTCKNCQNEYSRNWKWENKDRLAPIRRKQYAERYGVIQKEKERIRKEQYPLRVRCQLLRAGMRNRSRIKGIEFDSGSFSVAHLMDRLSSNPNCECCGKLLDISFKSDGKANENSPSMDRVNPTGGYVKNNVAILCWRCNRIKQNATSQELRVIADFMDSWGDGIELGDKNNDKL